MEDESRGWNTVSRKAERLVLNFLSEAAKEESVGESDFGGFYDKMAREGKILSKRLLTLSTLFVIKNRTTLPLIIFCDT